MGLGSSGSSGWHGSNVMPDRAMCYSIPSLLPFIANPFGLQKQQPLGKRDLVHVWRRGLFRCASDCDEPRLYESMNTMRLAPVQKVPSSISLVKHQSDAMTNAPRYNLGNVIGRFVCQWYIPHCFGLVLGLAARSSRLDRLLPTVPLLIAVDDPGDLLPSRS